MLVIVQNLPVPFDRRVWLECQTLTAAGYDVTVVCPTGEGTDAEQVLDGVKIVPYRGYAPGTHAIGYVKEYAYSFLATVRVALRERRAGAFDVVQACNPPDIFWPLARWLRLRDGTRFVFDHHDLCPELYRSRFPAGSGVVHGALYRGLLMLERATFRSADRVTSTNESYRDIAIDRGGKHPTHVRVVRTGPDPQRMRRGAADPDLKRGRKHLVAYLGVMGPQDGVEIVVRAADHIVNTLGRSDVTFVLMGSGDTREALIAERDRLGLQDYVELPGRVPDETVTAVLSTADLGLSPDPLNPLNDVSTMNKTMEYMAFGLPVVAFDLRETRYSAQEAAVYAEPNEVEAFAERIVALLDDPAKRAFMGRYGRQRVVDELAWEHQAKRYVEVFDELVAHVTDDAADRLERPDIVVDLREPQPAAEAAGPASAEA